MSQPTHTESDEPSAANTERDVSDRVALARLREGDVGALDVLYYHHAGALLQIATRMLGARTGAEDVVHDVFVSVVRGARTLATDADVGAWLRTLTINRCIDGVRSAARRDRLGLRLVAAAPTAADDARDVVVAERIERALAALPEVIRVVFVLRAVEGHSHPEIARALGIRVGTSEVRYHRAVRALRAALGDLR